MKKMDKNIDKNKSVCMKLLLYFDEFCKKNNLKYSLAYGSAIGAIRHKGFIPWDDDIDVIMPRNDYNKLKRVFENTKYHLFTEDSEGYYYQYAKLVDMNYPIKEINRKEKTMGLWIDIFPIDKIGNYNKFKAKLLLIYKYLFWFKGTEKKYKVLDFKNFILKKMSDCISIKKLLKLYNKTIENNKDKKVKYFCSSLPYKYKEFFDFDLFEDIIPVEFEGAQVKLIKDYDLYLTQLYGDYMKMPSVEKRRAHHNFEYL